MTDETQAASGSEPAAKDLDSIIFDAIEKSSPDDAPAADAAAEASPEPKADDAGRLRGPDGKFVAKPAETPAAEAPDKGHADAATTPAPAATPEPAPQPLEAPARWTADEKAKFAAWPRDVQEAVIERHKAMEADYTRKTQEAAELRRHAEPILNAVRPYEDYLRQVAPVVGQTPDQMVGSLLGVEYQLRTGDPYQKVTALHQIAQSYGIDLAAISRGEMPAAPDPHYQQLRQSYGSLEQRLAQFEQQIAQEQQRQSVQQIEAFRTAADASGRPLHPHFERVRGVMGQLMREEPSLTLDAAYQKAVEPIQQAIAEELKQREAEADRQRQAALEKARKAAPVKSTGSQPNGSTKAKDLDSILSDAINSRLS